MSIIAINNWVIGISAVATVIGLVGGTITVKMYKSNMHSIFSSISYAGFIAFVIFAAIRGVLAMFSITGD